MKNDIFEKGSTAKIYFTLTLPVVFSNLIQLIYNMVDTYFISAIGDKMIVAGVSLVSPIFILLIALSDIFGLGGVSAVSRMFGAKNNKGANRINKFAMYSVIAFSFLVTLGLMLGRTPILVLFGATEDTIRYASDYYTWIVLGAPFTMFTLVAGNLLRSEGLSKAVMLSSVVGSIVNIILDPIFISVLGLGAAGAAQATFIAHVASFGILLYVYLRKSPDLTLDLKDFYIKKQEAWEVFKIGLPAAVTNLTQALASVLLNRHLVVYGNDHVAAHGIAVKLNMIIMMAIVGFTFGSQPLVGYVYGSGDRTRLKKTLRFIYSYVMILSIVLAALMSITAPYLIRFFMDDPIIIESGSAMLRALQLAMPFYGVCMISTIFFQSAGKALPALLVSLCRQGVFYFIVIEIGSLLLGYYGTIYAQAVSDALTAFMSGALLLNIYKKEMK